VGAVEGADTEMHDGGRGGRAVVARDGDPAGDGGQRPGAEPVHAPSLRLRAAAGAQGRADRVRP
jgi:hypothetical protein